MIFTVSQLNRYAANIIATDRELKRLSLVGEISGYREYPSGHRYFALKDEECSIRCVQFKLKAARMTFKPKDGMKVLAIGYVGIYERDGQFQFYVEGMMEAGSGELYQDFQKTREKLEAAGLFSAEHKRSLPVLPRRIGVVTSRAGAVIRDIINVTKRRFPSMNILLCHAGVQGDAAPDEICSAIEQLNRVEDVDVIIVGRGGGSAEDLSAFNTESVAYAIYNSNKPVISAVGHETDFTITDMVADMRAPTPSAAAELAVPDAARILRDIGDRRNTINRALDAALYGSFEKLRSFYDSGAGGLVKGRLGLYESIIDRAAFAMDSAVRTELSLRLAQLETLQSSVLAADPRRVLARGYAFIKRAQGQVLTRENAMPGEHVVAILADGEVNLQVEE